jgi:hypothetical protein
VLNAMCCGQVGKRTIFTIFLTQGQARDITRYSLVSSEGEVLLPPGSRFRVISVMDAGHGLTLIQVRLIVARSFSLGANALDLVSGFATAD